MRQGGRWKSQMRQRVLQEKGINKIKHRLLYNKRDERAVEVVLLVLYKNVHAFTVTV